MLYSNNLEELIFNRHELYDVDELIVISGYLGPAPVRRLRELPIRTRVVYGMYGSDRIRPGLHGSLTAIQEEVDNVNIFYSTIPVHSKCYVWREGGVIRHALLGSANFSTQGLTTPFREILAETTRDTFDPLNDYLQHVFNQCISCLEVGVEGVEEEVGIEETCLMSLVANNGEVQEAAGLNWGQNPNNHTTPNDAYIPIRTRYIRDFPNLFSPKMENPLEEDNRGRPQRHNDAIEIIWDDGVTMEGLMEGSQPIDGIKYPKQISSFPIKAELGEYLRGRIGVPLGQPVRRHHLDTYGRTDISVSLEAEGVYRFDFSV